MSPPTKLAILDDYASIAAAKFAHFSPEQITIDYFPETLNPRTNAGREALIARLQPYAIVSTMRERTPFSREVLAALPNLKLLLTTGMRNAGIDDVACKELGIVYVGTSPKGITYVPGQSVTNEHHWALLLGLAKNVARDDLVVKTGVDGGWQNGLVTGLAGKTIGVLGLGRLGAQAATTAKLGFGMEVLCWSSSLTQEKADEVAAGVGLPKGSFKVAASKRELCEKADVLSMQYVLSERSRGIIGREELKAMKKTALLVNTSRGPLVDEEALLEALMEGRIRGVALDVFDVEPLPKDSPWRSTEWGKDGKSQVLLSPHMGYVEENVMHVFYQQHAENVERWLNGEEVIDRF